MNTSFTLHNIDFEWDIDKAGINQRKHKISFEKSCEVFFDPFIRIVDSSENGEARDAAIGYTEDSQMLFVVHVIRQENTIRIISARPATKAERKDYENF
jgi:uncharacterized DUF497 family protein